MKNDAKLGMLAGVLGVVVAAVLFAKAPPPEAQSRPGVADGPKTKDGAPTAAAPAPAPEASPAAPTANTAALPSTPVVRTRNEPAAQPTGRSGGTDEEP
jgi:hypothetical protein